jgi:hypothetical protein
MSLSPPLAVTLSIFFLSGEERTRARKKKKIKGEADP